MSVVEIYTAEQAAAALGCSVKTVEDWARSGALPGLKPGGAWVFPAGALARRLDELALEQAAERRKPAKPATVATTSPCAQRTGRKARALPKLVDLRGAV